LELAVQRSKEETVNKLLVFTTDNLKI